MSGESQVFHPAERPEKLRVAVLMTEAFGSHGGVPVVNRNVAKSLADHPRLEGEFFSLRDGKADSRYTGGQSFHGCDGNWITFVAQASHAFLTRHYDLLLITDRSLFPLALLWKTVVKRPYLLFAHGQESWVRQRGVYGRALRGAHGVLATSEFARQQLCRNNDLSPDQVVAIPLCLDALAPAVDPNLRADDTPILLTVGRTENQDKGPECVIRAMPRILKALPDTRYVIAGVGRDLPRLHELARSIGVKPRVGFWGLVSDREKHELFLRSSLFILPGRAEGSGLAYLEAMQSGLPCIAGNGDGAREVVQDGINGLTVDPSDVDGVADAALRLLGDPGLRESMGHAGQRLLQSQFTFSEFAAAFGAILFGAIMEQAAEGQTAEASDATQANAIQLNNAFRFAGPSSAAPKTTRANLHGMGVLVHHTGSLGDTIIVIPALEALRRHYGKDSRIYLLHNAPRPGRVGPEEVLAGTGLVDVYLPYLWDKDSMQGLVKLAWLGRKLARWHFDAVVSITSTRRSAFSLQWDRLFFHLCGIPKAIGFSTYPQSLLHPRDANGFPQAVPNEISLRMERLYKDGIGRLPGDFKPILSVPSEAQDSVSRWLAMQRQFPERPLVALSPGTNMTSKLWPLERFTEVGAYLLNRKECEVVVLGGPTDQPMAGKLLASWGRGIDATGRFSVLESAALLQHCKFIVTVDSGPMHLASAVGLSCVVLMSGRDFPGRWDPLGDRHVTLRHPVPCGACFCEECPVEGHPCMTGIQVDQVLQSIDRFL